MKTKNGLLCLLLIAFTHAFTASRVAATERQQTECYIKKFSAPALQKFNVAPQKFTLNAGLELTLYAIAPAPPELNTPTICWPVNEKPLGSLKNKHHSPWLFEPVKIC